MEQFDQSKYLGTYIFSLFPLFYVLKRNDSIVHTGWKTQCRLKEEGRKKDVKQLLLSTSRMQEKEYSSSEVERADTQKLDHTSLALDLNLQTHDWEAALLP